MDRKVNISMAGVTAFCFLMVFAPLASGEEAPEDQEKGWLEVECNIAHVPLTLCPKRHFQHVKKKTFFGLFSQSEPVCTKEEINLGSTPIQPFALPAGDYILLIPEPYFQEKEGPLEIRLNKGQKTYQLLKLLTHDANHGGAGGGGGGGAAGGGR